MKNLKKNFFSVGLAFSMLLGVVFSFIPKEANAIQEITQEGTIKCHHNANGSGTTNFCAGTECVPTSGTGSTFKKCGA